MRIQVVAKQQIHVGKATVIKGPAPEGQSLAVFEDDGRTGYFYALDTAMEGSPVQDAVHIYNVADISDRHLPSVAEIGWSADNLKVVLLINNYPHAVFDFQTRRGFCRTGFPPTSGNKRWSAGGHFWDDAAMECFG
jgi:hypothetical protein